ncbi:hypothetical protein HanRHA438_Chr09g0399731 [Helianthus annuus]|uniref:Uncharacterized protein n=1 Tax=Helianthus annuus TaxID=4232 RepID=A0A9K3N8I9_HELAN|nr:hypothetical protein HanXRQr2_Chr09g0388261 [Helianthus annuus]KAJ0534337.1 hypothetical protein HanIR_Chr09g0418591 [Helianthus annuus]KAJ0888234.1 hypothetical protein HanRHA438_Chr09g0399731 [Helianthus annuus]KAJ0893141.1 hypothetical protein HanPSC8_Chr09g0374231 [Helianthus annuus]
MNQLIMYCANESRDELGIVSVKNRMHRFLKKRKKVGTGTESGLYGIVTLFDGKPTQKTESTDSKRC